MEVDTPWRNVDALTPKKGGIGRRSSGMGIEVTVDSFWDDLIKGRILDAFSLIGTSHDVARLGNLMHLGTPMLRQEVQGSSLNVYSHCY